MSESRIKNPSGIVWALYVSGPSKKGILLPIGSCVIFDVKNKCCLTASHVLEAAPQKLNCKGGKGVKSAFDPCSKLLRVKGRLGHIFWKEIKIFMEV